MMTLEEAKVRISEEFMTAYMEWLMDEKMLPDDEYGRKYGWGKGKESHKDSLKSAKVFQQYFFAGRYLPGWVKAGYPSDVIWKLHDEGFLSYKLYSNWEARHTGRSDWFFIPQRTVKQIYDNFPKT